MRYLIDFSYSGARFNGYQKQPGLRCVQTEIENVLTDINNKKSVIIYSAGRTDTKVNALHQMAHFDLEKKIEEYKLKGALNSYLPNDIHINSVKMVEDSFHARYMVKKKTYEYKLSMNEYNPLEKDYIYQYGRLLDIEEMKKAIIYFKGTHDFTSFICAEDKREDKVRNISRVSLKEKKGIIYINFEGKGFLKYQVRNMVGLLIKIGEGKYPCDIVPKMLSEKDRKKASICAPAEGLTLINIKY